jgi:response regulator of citrate/malate metabolism
MDEYIRLKVLVIEDNQMFRNLALRMIPDCKKYSAITAKEGLDTFKKLRPDITFLDIGLPDGNGLDLLKQMRSIMPNAFVVMFTQSRVSSDVETAVKNGAAGYISKPFSQKEMQNYFERYREHKKKFSANDTGSNQEEQQDDVPDISQEQQADIGRQHSS